MNKQEAKAIVRANLKGKKKKEAPLLVIAEAVKLLANDPEYGTTTKLANCFGVKRPTIEAFNKMNGQPPEILKLIEDGKIGIDINPKLVSIADTQRRIAVANAVAGLRNRDAREIIAKCKEDNKIEPEECKKVILDTSKSSLAQKKLITISLEPSEYSKFLKASKEAGLNPKETLRKAVSEWIQRQH